jgi:two-component system chemotaxis response regulator CheY
MAFDVLIVDDSPSMRKIIRRVIMLSGFETGVCLEAGDGLEALKVLENVSVDIVLTDINMPNMNGEELVERLAADPARSSIPILVISTDRSEERINRLIMLGACGYVTKPFVPETLGAALTQIVGEADHDTSAF